MRCSLTSPESYQRGCCCYCHWRHHLSSSTCGFKHSWGVSIHCTHPYRCSDLPSLNSAAYSEWESLELGYLHGFLAFGCDCVFQACVFHIDNLELAILPGSPGSFSGELVIRNYNLKKKREEEIAIWGQRCLLLLIIVCGSSHWMELVYIHTHTHTHTRTFKIKTCLSWDQDRVTIQIQIQNYGAFNPYLVPSLSFQLFFSGRLVCFKASLVTQMVKNLLAMQETWVWSLVKKFLWRREWEPTLVFLPGEFCGQRSLEGD